MQGAVSKIFFIFVLTHVHGLDNGLAKVPPMGWMSWGRYRCNVDCINHPKECISENLFTRISKELISGGYADAGYEYVIIDDCWMEKERDINENLVPDRERFPNGMKHLSDYIHSLKLKFGIYENYGTLTCEKYPGSKHHIKSDVKLFAEWEADYVKLDGCFTSSDELDFGYPAFGQELNKTGRPMVFSCSWPYYQEHIFHIKPDYSAIKKYCNLWRNFHDISDSWLSIKYTMYFYSENQERMKSYSGPGHWNDPDMLMIGNNGLNVGQSRVQMAIWSILAAPLIMSNDLPNIPDEMKSILLNRDVIAVNQDPLGIQGGMHKNLYGDLKIWLRPLIPIMNGMHSYAIAFVNLNSAVEQRLTVDIKDFGLKSPYGYCLMDLFASTEIKNMTILDPLTVIIQPMDVVFYKLRIL